jgi:hypothetical protein
MKRAPSPELEELIESIEQAPPPSRQARRLPRRLLISLFGIAAFLTLLAAITPTSLVAVISDPFRAIELAIETIGNAISILLR